MLLLSRLVSQLQSLSMSTAMRLCPSWQRQPSLRLFFPVLLAPVATHVAQWVSEWVSEWFLNERLFHAIHSNKHKLSSITTMLQLLHCFTQFCQKLDNLDIFHPFVFVSITFDRIQILNNCFRPVFFSEKKTFERLIVNCSSLLRNSLGLLIITTNSEN